jgi:glycosyltransferase involved in cell wall biosynthesis
MQLPYLPQQIAEQLAMLLYLAFFLVQMAYFWGVFRRLAFHGKKEEAHGAEPVSVVICARNEYARLKKNIPLIMAQDHPDFELVVVNDNSQDDTLELLEDFSREYPRLKIVNLSQDLNFFRGKKFPLSIGIKSASHDIILLTDADCSPSSGQWISRMSRNFIDGKEIVLGYGAYEPKPGLLNLLLRYDTLWVAIQYLSFALSGNAYMGVGRNMAYRKSLFYKHKGFSSHYTVSSGDDDLFINLAATRHNVAVEVAAGSHTISEPKRSLTAWVKQKRRHLTTWKYYRPKYKWLLGAWSFSQAAFWIMFALLLALEMNILVTLGVFVLRLASQLLITKKCMNKLNEKKLLLFSPIAELYLIVFYPVLSVVNYFSKPDKWK